MDPDTVLEDVYEHCADAYFAARQYNKDYGFDPFGCSADESDMLYALLFPENKEDHHYFSRVAPWNPLLPKPLRTVIKEDRPKRSFDNHELYLFHYDVDADSVLEQLDERRDVWEQRDVPEGISDPHPDQYHSLFTERFTDASCLAPFFTGIGERRDYANIPLLVGDSEIMEDVIDVVKNGYDEASRFLRAVGEEGGAEHVLDETEKIHVYDLTESWRFSRTTHSRS